MYSVSFIFEPGTYDARFHELNARIDAAARANPGFLAAESWRSPDGRRSNATYYWASLDALREFSMHPQHVEAKREYERWYRDYQIVIAEVVRSYGDGAFAHVTPNERQRAAATETSACRVRQASVHDLDALAPLFDAYRQFYRQAPDLPRAREFLAERFRHHESIVLLAADAPGGAVGFTQLYPLFSSVRAARIYLLNDLYVAPDARRGGVGRQLLTASADFARANGASSLILTTAVDNVPAQRLYESLGWVRDGGFHEYCLSL